MYAGKSRISNLEHRTFEIIQSKNEKKKKNEWTKEGLRDQKDVFKINNICIKGIPEERGRKNIYRNNGQKVPNLMKDMNLCVQEVQWTSSRLNSKKPT